MAEKTITVTLDLPDGHDFSWLPPEIHGLSRRHSEVILMTVGDVLGAHSDLEDYVRVRGTGLPPPGLVRSEETLPGLIDTILERLRYIHEAEWRE